MSAIYDGQWKLRMAKDAVLVLNQGGPWGQTLLFVVERNGDYYIEAGLMGSIVGSPAPLDRQSLAMLGRMLLDEFDDDGDYDEPGLNDEDDGIVAALDGVE